jgi:hypothetical protein
LFEVQRSAKEAAIGATKKKETKRREESKR